MPKIIVAIDGYSSCGKSTTAKLVAAQLGYAFIDTGAMYRAVSLYFYQHHVSLTNPREVENALKHIEISFQFNEKTGKSDTYLNGLNVEGEIRKMYISNMVSEVSAIPMVRYAMVAQQKRMGKLKGIVMDGRDVGTVVFPMAEVKFFMTADPVIRAQRRQIELLEKGDAVDIDDILENIKKRDHIDTTRSEGPLRQAEDAIVLDTSHYTIEQQVEVVLHKVGEILRNMKYEI
jgi:CMP/dCMP kinase